MHDDIVLPVRNKFVIPSSRSYTRIQFVQEKTRNSLFYLKWLELIACLLCLSFTFITIQYTDITKLNKTVLIITNSVSVCLILAEISFPYFKKNVPLVLQIIEVGFNSIMYGLLMVLIYQTNNPHDLVNALKILHGATSVLFLVDFLCKIIISKLLYQTTQAKSVADIGISTNLPSPPRKPARSALTATPITYGGTFPVRKNQPPFLSNTSIFVNETSEKTNRHKPVDASIFDFGPSSVERLINQEQTPTLPPFYLNEERKKRTQWTNTKRRQKSTPITYGGTFACDKELVPSSLSSPSTSPRTKKPNINSSPTREYVILDQISEEKLSMKISAGNCSLTDWDCGLLPGCTLINETL